MKEHEEETEQFNEHHTGLHKILEGHGFKMAEGQHGGYPTYYGAGNHVVRTSPNGKWHHHDSQMKTSGKGQGEDSLKKHLPTINTGARAFNEEQVQENESNYLDELKAGAKARYDYP